MTLRDTNSGKLRDLSCVGLEIDQEIKRIEHFLKGCEWEKGKCAHSVVLKNVFNFPNKLTY